MKGTLIVIIAILVIFVVLFLLSQLDNVEKKLQDEISFDLCFAGDTFAMPEETCTDSLKGKDLERCTVINSSFANDPRCHVSYFCVVKCP